MAEKRKLMAEMDKVFRKVDEGVEVFEDTMAKMQEANSDNQREKFQDDLKKEIKKLQRLRDQIKGWQNSNEIKDKEKLITYRKSIETKMEQFKDIERENKTKPHSKQGLNAEEKMDPKEKERAEMIEWLQTCIGRLNEQRDFFESELENLTTGNVKKKKGDKDRARHQEELAHKLERHKHHVQKLEIIMRLLNNETLETDQVKQVHQIEDEIEDYINRGQDPDFVENEFLYEDLDLGDLAELAQQLGNVTTIGTLEEPENTSETSTAASGSPVPSPSPGPQSKEPSVQPDAVVEPPKVRHFSGDADSLRVARASAALSHVASSSRSTPATPLKLTSQMSLDSALSTPPPTATPPPIVPGIPYNSVAAKAAIPSPKVTSAIGGHLLAASRAKEGSSSPDRNSPLSSPESESCGEGKLVESPVVSLPQMRQFSSSPLDPVSVASSVTSLRSPPPLLANAFASGGDQTSSQVFSFPVSITSLLRPHQPSASPTFMNGPDDARIREASGSVLSLKSIAEQAVPPGIGVPSVNAVAAIQEQRRELPDLNSMTSLSDGTSIPYLNAYFSRSGLPVSTQQQDAKIPPILGASPLGKVAPTSEQTTQLSILESAISRLPLPLDSEHLRQYLTRNPCQTPAYYPQVPPPLSDTLEYFNRLNPETLFFIFYYMEGTKAQYLAAKALKKQSWRFHKKYLMWFQRHEEPTCITEEYEQGTYVYFDFEKWSQRKKEGFTFEYRFLEDRDLS